MLPGKPQRYDYEYQRNGTCSLLILFQPSAAWRHVKVTERRTKRDFARCMKEMVDVHLPDADTLRVVLDNLITHTPAASYEAFDAAEARRLVRELEFHYTPKHGSWLNMAVIEISVLRAQCLDRYIPDIAALDRTVKARDKLKRLYPAQLE